uniref:Uncharacterized protein n=1 Tax=Rhizophora mucronata TaxID=61149 RepID=A0A2P2R456_RHIMU
MHRLFLLFLPNLMQEKIKYS